MYDHLRIASYPLCIAQSDKMANINAVKTAIASMPSDLDILCLPELFSTGFISDKEAALAAAETSQGSTIDFLLDMANQYRCAICGSFLAKSGPWLYNRAFFVEPGGETTFYDKRHLFSISKEADIMNAGSQLPPVIRFRGWNVAIAVCYDLRFPIWMRNKGLKYDLMIVPANWPSVRQHAWINLLEARAIENEAYIIGANRAGEDKFGIYDDMTYIFDYAGENISLRCGDYVCASLNMSALIKFREDFPFWKDSDTFEVNI